jgi:hypothetical protein
MFFIANMNKNLWIVCRRFAGTKKKINVANKAKTDGATACSTFNGHHFPVFGYGCSETIEQHNDLSDVAQCLGIFTHKFQCLSNPTISRNAHHWVCGLNELDES